MNNFFDIVAPIYEKLHFGAQKTFDKIKSIAIFESSDKVVDLGGGTGRIANLLADEVQKITVVDTSEGMLKQCRQRHPKLSCIQAKAQNLPFADDSVNKVIIVVNRLLWLHSKLSAIWSCNYKPCIINLYPVCYF